MFDISYFRAAWAKGIICSIFKGGIKNNPGDYRGISLLSCIRKIFTGIINNKRLVNWTEKRKLFGYSQADICAACPNGKIFIEGEREILLLFC